MLFCVSLKMNCKKERVAEQNMKKAFSNFFERMNESWKRVWGTNPKTSVNTKFENCGLYISEEDENGNREWSPKLQEDAIDFFP